MKTGLFIFTFIFAKQFCFSQNGNLYGKIKDASNNDELGGVKITLSNSQCVYSDFDGNFSAQNIPAGKYTLKLSSLGYTDFITKEIEIKEDETLQLEFSLSESSNELNTFAKRD